MWHRLKLLTAIGTAAILAILLAGTVLVRDQGDGLALHAAEAALERAAQAAETALNRQLLQVDGALASLPTLLALASPADPSTAFVTTPASATRAGQLLRGLNFQNLAFRDLLLVGHDGQVWASARARSPKAAPPFDVGAVGRVPAAGSASLVGPVRNRVTGDWALYVVRAITGPGNLTAAAEIPLPALMRLLAETGVDPSIRIALQRPDGRLIAALPHDEVMTGQVQASAPGIQRTYGRASAVVRDGGEGRNLVVWRSSLYRDVVLALSIDERAALAGWTRDRERIAVAAGAGALLIAAFGAALLVALRQRERVEAESARTASVLANAIEAMSDGFVMWDAQDRLVTCNQRYRDLYALSAPAMRVGARFEDIIRQGIEAGQYPQATGGKEAFVEDTVRWHREARGAIERLLPDGRWLLITERRTEDGGIVGIRTDITELKAAHAELAAANARANDAAADALRQNVALTEREGQIRFLAHHDDLTKLPNRVLFRSQVEEALRAGAAGEGRAALLYLDLDRFKDVNDSLGHPAGDALLHVVAKRLRGCVAGAGQVARLGGDEFGVLCPSGDQPQRAEALSLRIIAALSQPCEVLGHTVTVGASVGIAVADGADVTADILLKQADLALYRAKADGRSTFRVFAPEMDEKLRAKLQLEADLSRALTERQLEMAYQPIYDLATDRLYGFEALMRWYHPERGPVSPAEFIPVAEETRLIVAFGTWALRQACADIGLLPRGTKVAVNLSPVQLAAEDLVETVEAALRDAQLDAGCLELEITETALFANDRRNADVLRRLRALGVRIVLDDFGTGYSSLSHLRLGALDKIKIDRSFVRDMAVRPDSATIVSAVADLAQRLGMTTTAEGIETAEQWDLVRAAGCTQGQGYLVGKPQPILLAVGLSMSARIARKEAILRSQGPSHSAR